MKRPAPSDDTRSFLRGAAKWLTQAADGRTSVVEATDAARRLIDRALDAEVDAA